MHQHIVIISGSSPLDARVVAAIPHDAVIVAVDGGLDHARGAGLAPSHLIGDLDSVSPSSLGWADAHATVRRHPTDKNHTDTELAVAFAVDMAPTRLTLIGGGDRLDHSLAAIGALGHDHVATVARLDGWWDGQHLDVLHGPGRLGLELAAGSTLSLLALHGPCSGVHISGVQWPLDDATLRPLAGHGVSNLVDGDATAGDTRHIDLRVESGILTIFDVPAVVPPATNSAPISHISGTSGTSHNSATSPPSPPSPAKDLT